MKRNLLLIMTVIVVFPHILFSSEATGRFYISGNKIIDPYGELFVAKGTNVQGMKWVWPGDILDHLDLVTKAWKFNTVRVNCKLYDGYWNGENVSVNAAYQTIEEMTALVDSFTKRKVVVMLDMHDKTGGFYEGSDLEDMKDAWREICDRFGENTYVWFNIMNEPGGMDNVNAQWVSMHREVIGVIRDEKKADNIIVIDGQHWGQDVGDWNANPVKEENSAILKSGLELIHFNDKAYENILFSIHIYDQWNGGSGGISQEQANYKLSDFIDKVHAKSMALIIGEYGTNTSEGDLYYPEAFRAVHEVAIAKNIGRIWWHWYGGDVLDLTTDGNGGGWHVNDHTNPTNLSWPGQIIWNDNHFEGNRYPYVNIIDPANNDKFVAPASIPFIIDASDPDNGIDRVEILWGDSIIAVLTEPPYQFEWNDVPAGSYRVTARAVDHEGLSNNSLTIQVVVEKSTTLGTVLFVTGSALLSEGDHAIYDRLIKSGYKVLLKSDSEATTGNATNKLCVLISASVGSGNVGTKFRDVDVPVMVWEPWLYDDMNMTGAEADTDFGTVESQYSLSFSDAEHEILENISAETGLVGDSVNMGFGIPVGDVSHVLSFPGEEKAALFVYETGAEMNGMPAPAGRAGIFLMDEVSTVLTDTGWEVFDQSVDWLIGQKADPSKIHIAENKNFRILGTYPNPFHRSTTFSYELINPGNVSIEILDITGRNLGVLYQGFQNSGIQKMEFINGEKITLSPGVYFCYIRIGNFSDLQKIACF